MKKLPIITRSALGILVCFYIYKEAGIVTAIFAAVMIIYTELNSWHLRLVQDQQTKILAVFYGKKKQDEAAGKVISNIPTEKEQKELIEKFKKEKQATCKHEWKSCYVNEEVGHYNYCELCELEDHNV